MAKTIPITEFWPSSVQIPEIRIHDEFVAKINNLIAGNKTRFNAKDRSKQDAASNWLIEALYQCHFSIPRGKFILPLGKGCYGPSSSFKIPHGHHLIRQALEAAKQLGFLTVIPGVWIKDGKGECTRLIPAGRLLDHFRKIGLRWRYVPAPRRETGIFLNPGKGAAGRRLVDRCESKAVRGMQDSLHLVNQYLSQQCISIDLPDVALLARYRSKKKGDLQNTRHRTNDRSAMGMQNVFLHRVFAQGSLKKGGRLYGAWWQQIRSTARRRILINGDVTVECDFSGLACAMLYAREGLVPPVDPYDISLGYSPNDKRRKLVKRYLNAVLNDSSRKFKLEPNELVTLGLTHAELHKRLAELHAPIARHFNSGVGVDLQYVDSEMALEIILRLMRKGEPCLPVHDSYIVRAKSAGLLLQTMTEVFRERFGQDPGIKPEFGYRGVSMSRPSDGLLSAKGLTILEKFTHHIAEYSITRDFLQSWETACFSDEDRELRYRTINHESSYRKDCGMYPLYRHQFYGLPTLMAARL